MNADGSGKRRIGTANDDEYPDWSPDGEKIAFHSGRDGNWEIYVMDADGAKATRLTKNPGEDTHPAWSPDGEWIAFASERGGRTDIYVMRPDGTRVRRLTTHPGWDYGPAWSPDGTRLVFESDRALSEEERNAWSSDAPPPYQLYIMSADGSDVRLLTSSDGSDLLPSWRR